MNDRIERVRRNYDASVPLLVEEPKPKGPYDDCPRCLNCSRPVSEVGPIIALLCDPNVSWQGFLRTATDRVFLIDENNLPICESCAKKHRDNDDNEGSRLFVIPL